MENKKAKASNRAAVDLDKLILDFANWQDASTELVSENDQLHLQVRGLQSQCSLHLQAAQASASSNAQLRTMVERLQGTLVKRCDLEDENDHLKEQITNTQASATVLEEAHRRQMTEAVENLQAVHKAHKREVAQMQEAASALMKSEVDSLQRTIEDKQAEIRQLQKQLSDTERDRHTEVVKLRLEYDAKLLKLQKQNSLAQNTRSSASSTNHEIFRKKLQHAKLEGDRENSSLRKRVADLEHQLSLASKRRRL